MHLTTLHTLDNDEGTVQLRQSLTTATSDNDRLALILHPPQNPHDAADPLRWPSWLKHASFTALCAFTFLTNFGVSALAPALPRIASDFSVSQDTASDLIIWPLLLFGLGNFFWVPVAHLVGKRPVFLIATATYTAAQAWGASATSFESLFASIMLATAMGSASEALGASLVNDLFFLHERSTRMGFYTAAIALGNAIGPLICGYMTERVGWRWYKGLAATLMGVDFLTMLMLLPETRYDRFQMQAVGGEVSHEPSEKDTRVCLTEAPSKALPPSTTKDIVPLLSPLPRLPPDTDAQKVWVTILRPFPLILFPSVLYSTLAYGISLAWVISVSTLLPFIIQAPPYNFSPGTTGLLNIPNIIGNVLGALLGGTCVDIYSDYRARRNRGIFMPEFRLPLLMIPTLLVPAGLVLLGYAFAEHLHWAAIAVGFGLTALALTAIPSASMTYVSDCLLPVQGDALLVVNGVKNVLAFAFNYAIVPWSRNQGYVNFFGTQAGLFVAVVGGGALALCLYGEFARARLANWRIILEA